MGIINYKADSHILNAVTRFDSGEKFRESSLKTLDLDTLCRLYLCAIDLEVTELCTYIDYELMDRNNYLYIVPRELFKKFPSDIVWVAMAQRVRDAGITDGTAFYNIDDLRRYILSYNESPGYYYVSAYITALALGETKVAESLKADIKAIPTLAACMPTFLRKASGSTELIAKLSDFRAKFYSKKLRELYQADLEEDIEKHDELNQKLFDGESLKPEIKDKAVEVADELIKMLAEGGIDLKLKDLVITGSNASYNYTKNSDIDLHLVADLTGTNDPDGLYPVLFNSVKSAFNKKFNISFYGIPVEVYIEVEDTQIVSNGIYSVLTDSWIKEPENTEIPEVDQEAVNKAVAPWEDRYLKLEGSIDKNTSADESVIDKYIDDLYELRATGLKEGEYSTGNLVFKEIRNKGYLDKLKELRDIVVTNRLSIK